MDTFFSKDAEKYFFNLVEACGISGNTRDVAALLRERLNLPHIRLQEDPAGMGHVVGVINPGQNFKVLLGAHMDAVGMRVTLIDSLGFVYFRSVGGLDAAALKGQKVKIWTRKGLIAGLIQHVPSHHMEEEFRRRLPDIDDFWVRTEFIGRQGPENPIEVGNPITFAETAGAIGEHLLAGPGFDNRAGILIMGELMRRLNESNLKVTLHGVATSGEEIGCRGIRAITHKINPDLAIALDVTVATDYPKANIKKYGLQVMGKGPVIAIGYNTRCIYNEKLMEVARENNIPYQLRAEDITPTDGREMDEAGVPTIVVRLPGNMLHTSNDLIDRRDIETTSNLLYHFLQRLPF